MQANALGVWGNHDIGLCHRVEGRARARYPAAALDGSLLVPWSPDEPWWSRTVSRSSANLGAGSAPKKWEAFDVNWPPPRWPRP